MGILKCVLLSVSFEGMFHIFSFLSQPRCSSYYVPYLEHILKIMVYISLQFCFYLLDMPNPCQIINTSVILMFFLPSIMQNQLIQTTLNVIK